MKLEFKKEDIKSVVFLYNLSTIIIKLNTYDVVDLTFKFKDRLKAEKQMYKFTKEYNLVLNDNSKNCYVVK